MNALTQYIDLYREHRAQIDAHAPEALNRRREGALKLLADSKLPDRGEETYTALSVNDMFAPDYGVNINRIEFPLDTSASFRCGVPNISTLLGLVVNDTFRATSTLERNLTDGVQLMSLATAAKLYPELIDRYLGAQVPDTDISSQLNTLLLQDGVLIRVPQGVEMSRPLQIVNIFNAVAPIMGVRRILVIVEANAKASILVCDHSQLQDIPYLSNQVIELYVGENATLEYYDLEETSEHTSRISKLYATQAQGSRLVVNGSTLIGGTTRNVYTINVDGDYATTKLAGMAIGGDQQVIDNVTDVRHHSVGSTSSQMYKYVLDQQATGAFYGTIVVDEDAKYTNAYQSNRNILASEDARMYTRPQLEIYCDEVKCSHGATVGQLDASALFYMRSRGIPQAEARLMLMQAFMADVIDTVSIPALKIRLQQLVESRLSGNRVLCSACEDI